MFIGIDITFGTIGHLIIHLIGGLSWNRWNRWNYGWGYWNRLYRPFYHWDNWYNGPWHNPSYNVIWNSSRQNVAYVRGPRGSRKYKLW